MRNGCKLVWRGHFGTYSKIMPSGKMQIKVGSSYYYADLNDVRPAARFGDNIPFIGWLFR